MDEWMNGDGLSSLQRTEPISLKNQPVLPYPAEATQATRFLQYKVHAVQLKPRVCSLSLLSVGEGRRELERCLLLSIWFDLQPHKHTFARECSLLTPVVSGQLLRKSSENHARTFQYPIRVMSTGLVHAGTKSFLSWFSTFSSQSRINSASLPIKSKTSPNTTLQQPLQPTPPQPNTTQFSTCVSPSSPSSLPPLPVLPWSRVPPSRLRPPTARCAVALVRPRSAKRDPTVPSL